MGKYFLRFQLLIWAYLTDKIFGDDFFDEFPECQKEIGNKMINILNN